jgi:hypothetical protein
MFYFNPLFWRIKIDRAVEQSPSWHASICPGFKPYLKQTVPLRISAVFFSAPQDEHWVNIATHLITESTLTISSFVRECKNCTMNFGWKIPL